MPTVGNIPGQRNVTFTHKRDPYYNPEGVPVANGPNLQPPERRTKKWFQGPLRSELIDEFVIYKDAPIEICNNKACFLIDGFLSRDSGLDMGTISNKLGHHLPVKGMGPIMVDVVLPVPLRSQMPAPSTKKSSGFSFFGSRRARPAVAAAAPVLADPTYTERQSREIIFTMALYVPDADRSVISGRHLRFPRVEADTNRFGAMPKEAESVVFDYVNPETFMVKRLAYEMIYGFKCMPRTGLDLKRQAPRSCSPVLPGFSYRRPPSQFGQHTNDREFIHDIYKSVMVRKTEAIAEMALEKAQEEVTIKDPRNW